MNARNQSVKRCTNICFIIQLNADKPTTFDKHTTFGHGSQLENITTKSF